MALSDSEKLKALRNGIAVGAIAAASVTPAQAVEKQADDRKINTENIMPRDNTRIEPATLKITPQDIQRAQTTQNIWKDPETKPIIIEPAKEEFAGPRAEQKNDRQAEPMPEESREQFEPLSAPEFQGFNVEMRFSEPEMRMTQDDYLSEAEQDRKYEYTDFIENYEAFHQALYEKQLELEKDRLHDLYHEDSISKKELDERIEKLEKGHDEKFDPRGKTIDFSKYDLEAIIDAGETDFINEDFMAQAGMLHWTDEALALDRLAEKTERLTDLALAGSENADLQKGNKKEQKTLGREIKKDAKAMKKSSSAENKKLLNMLSHFNRFTEKADNNEVTFDYEKDENTPASHMIITKKDMKPLFDYLNYSYKKAIKEYPHETVQTDINESMNHMDRCIDYDLKRRLSTLRGTAEEQPATVKTEQQPTQNQPLPQQLLQQIKNSR